MMKHLLFTLPLVFAALLFMGAGKITGQVRTRNDVIKETRFQCAGELANLRSCLPEKEREEWTRLAQETPVLLLQVTSHGTSPIPASPLPMPERE